MTAATEVEKTADAAVTAGSIGECWGPCQLICLREVSALMADTGDEQVVHPDDEPLVQARTVCRQCKRALRRHFGLGSQPHKKCKQQPSKNCTRLLRRWRVRVLLPNGEWAWKPMKFAVTTAQEFRVKMATAALLASSTSPPPPTSASKQKKRGHKAVHAAATALMETKLSGGVAQRQRKRQRKR